MRTLIKEKNPRQSSTNYDDGKKILLFRVHFASLDRLHFTTEEMRCMSRGFPTVIKPVKKSTWKIIQNNARRYRMTEFHANAIPGSNKMSSFSMIVSMKRKDDNFGDGDLQFEVRK